MKCVPNILFSLTCIGLLLWTVSSAADEFSGLDEVTMQVIKMEELPDDVMEVIPLPPNPASNSRLHRNTAPNQIQSNRNSSGAINQPDNLVDDATITTTQPDPSGNLVIDPLTGQPVVDPHVDSSTMEPVPPYPVDGIIEPVPYPDGSIGDPNLYPDNGTIDPIPFPVDGVSDPNTLPGDDMMEPVPPYPVDAVGEPIPYPDNGAMEPVPLPNEPILPPDLSEPPPPNTDGSISVPGGPPPP